MLRGLISDDFLPFGKLDFEIPPVENKPADLAEVHLITGVNGTGKSRLLSVLAAGLGNVTPLLDRTKGVNNRLFAVTDKSPFPDRPELRGSFHSSGWARFGVDPNHNGVQWHDGRPVAEWFGSVPAFAYRCTAYVADAEVKTLADVPRPQRSLCLSFDRANEGSSRLLQAIMNLKVQAAVDSMGPSGAGGITRSVKLISTLEASVSKITKTNFVFAPETKPNVSLRVIWGNRKLSFSVLPDGLRSIIGWLAHALVMMDLYVPSDQDPTDCEAVFLLDEIEGHLHPAWQRRVLPAFQHLFPKAQMFVATHSPFVISSLTHGWIHCLTVQPDATVKIEKPKPASEGSSYIDAVEEIMGVKEWYDDDSEKLLADFRAKRDAAYQGNIEAEKQARAIAAQISERSMELSFIMGRELKQMDRQLEKPAAK